MLTVASIKVNYIFNLVNSGTQILFPLITFPYASRIIGQVNFFNSIIFYITLFTCLGIPMYAIREIAKVRNDIKKTSVTTIEILSLHAILSILGYVAVAIICMTVTEVQVNIPLFLILSASIFFTAIGCEWFYQGIEDFKYVTIRGLVVKIVSIILLFLLVKNQEDILWYGVYNVLGVLGGNLFNYIRLRKFIDKECISIHDLHPIRHLKPALRIFVLNVITSIYLQLNTLLLGCLKDVTAVGYFTAATKLMQVTRSVPSSLGTVIMPHVSYLIAENKMDEFKTVSQKSYDFILAISIPLTIGLIFTSKSAILMLSGESFLPAVTSSQIVAFNIISIGISNVLGLQILYPMGKINLVTTCTFLGAIINVILNVVLIPLYGHNGSAMAFMATEAVVTSSMYIIGRKYFPHKLFKRQHLNYLFGGFLMIICLYGVNLIQLNYITSFIVMVIIGVVVYSMTLIIMKDPITILILNALKLKLGH